MNRNALARNPVVARKRQRGVILLLFFLVLFLAASGAIITVLDNNTVNQRRNDDTVVALREAKEALIAYAVLYSDYYSASGAGPGYLPCPDSNGNGLENAPCGSNSLGRLPASIVLPSGSNYPLSSYNRNIDEQFWYSVSDTFRRSPLGVLNSAAASTVTLDTQNRIAAVLIAPGPATGVQARPSNSSTRYLENGNTAAPNFVSSDAVNPETFNDRVLAITIDEIMLPITRKVADLVQQQLDAIHLVPPLGYPLTQVDFDLLLLTLPFPAWFRNNNWHLNIVNYNRVSADQATFSFNGCLNVTYEISYSAVDSPSNIRRVGSQC